MPRVRGFISAVIIVVVLFVVAVGAGVLYYSHITPTALHQASGQATSTPSTIEIEIQKAGAGALPTIKYSVGGTLPSAPAKVHLSLVKDGSEVGSIQITEAEGVLDLHELTYVGTPVDASTISPGSYELAATSQNCDGVSPGKDCDSGLLGMSDPFNLP